MRRSLPLLALFLATSCSGPGPQDRSSSQRDSSAPRNFDVAEPQESAAPPAIVAPPSLQSADSRAAAGPDVAPTAAPGVAFNYNYAFRLAAPRVAAVQEQHAQLCERLTVARCRITGMLYRVVNERDIEARLELKLDPAIARHFGRTGVEAVVRAEGMLIESQISGVDVGTSIQTAGRNLADLNAELARIEARLARRDVRSDERVQLDYQAQQLRQQIRDLRDSRDAQQQSLATTPMVFQYGSGDLVPGFGVQPSFGRALERAGDSFMGGLYVLFILVLTLLPWALVGLIGWWSVSRIRRRLAAAKPARIPSTEVSSD